jgi:hypothetical protein
MRESEKDISTRRFNTDEFDCTPPREAVEELRRTKRTFHPPDPPPRKSSRLEEARKMVNTAMFLAMGIAFIFAMLTIATRHEENRSADRKILYTNPVPAPTPTPVPTPAPPLPPTLPLPQVRRAELAVKRAEFVGLPVGWQGDIHMPDGTPMSVRYMGKVSSFEQLPRNPSYGDMWKVIASGATWVWCTPAGFAAPAWVDP